ncbi:sodium/potassium/calcium exchanger Nckx30C [Calliphora vicina]|uniref:sodium/potassium/calcium exchanger Nckx30C n=1 Tax=Calliphora vicina TaxID=7373 RepID=UPI00325AF8EB
MLQQHATCLQPHLLNSTTTLKASNSVSLAAETTTTAKHLICLKQQHETSPQNHTFSKQGITVNLDLKGADSLQQQQPNSNNVALHSLPQQNNIKSNNNCKNVDSKTLATSWALKVKQQGQNAQQPHKPGLAKGIMSQKPSFICLKLQKLKAQILPQPPATSLLNPAPPTNISKMMLPQHTETINQESLDFNSKRRRGRLRLLQSEKTEPEQLQQAKQEKYEAFNNVPAALYLNNVAKVTTTLLLTQMLSFMQQINNTFVNKPQQQIKKQQPENLVLSLINKIIIKLNINNNKKQRKNLQYPLTSSSSTSSTSTSSSSSSTFLLYAFLFLTTLLILPCHHPQALAEAAKPKSATQHNNNHLQHQHQQQQDKPNIAYAAGADNVHIDKEGTVLTPPSYQVVSSQTSNEEEAEYIIDSDERNFDLENESLNEVNEEEQEEERDSYEKFDNDTSYENNTVIKTPLFPTDLFTKEQLENGAVICHIIGVIYMFVALAIVCDEFFVPSLDVIIEKLGITDDVAGATFMAAGGSAPELFTSVIGVFVSFDDVGIGTIVGSAVFNILFVIGMCALFSKTVLTLTWWPLFRDCTFYSISLMVLIYFFRDNRIFWWEALILFSIYCAYVTFMKWNVEVESCVKKVITKNKVTRVRSTDQLMPAGNAANSSETSMATQPGGSVTSRAASESRSGPPGSSSGAGTTGNSSGGNASSTQTGAKFRHGLLQLMIHTIDPLHDGKVDEKATQLHAIASLKVLLDATKPQRGGATTSAANHVKINLKETTLADRPNGNIDTTLDSPSLSGRRASWIDQRVKIQTRKFSIKTQEIVDEPEPLSMAWPDTARKRLTYILVAPLLIPMWLTLPDTRTPKGKKLFPVTFIGSIVWIAAFSYLMVWWANVAGDTARIPPEVMGLTFLAAGTSIPDLITSVIVARKGFGDMAVSSSVGSNIFDVTVGLPIPWLLFGLINGAPVEVNSVGMVCSITILFMMLIFVVMSIACFRWRMNKGLGFTMFLLYFVFVAVSLMFEYDVITCPV